jgi:hypothetical protein
MEPTGFPRRWSGEGGARMPKAKLETYRAKRD